MRKNLKKIEKISKDFKMKSNKNYRRNKLFNKPALKEKMKGINISKIGILVEQYFFNFIEIWLKKFKG